MTAACRAIVIVLVLLLAGCGGDGGADPVACTLLPADDVAEIVGNDVEVVPETDDEFCLYQAPPGGVGGNLLLSAAPETEADEFCDISIDAFDADEPLDGLGNRAAARVEPDGLSARVGVVACSDDVVAELSFSGGVDEEVLLDAVVEMTRLVLDRAAGD